MQLDLSPTNLLLMVFIESNDDVCEIRSTSLLSGNCVNNICINTNNVARFLYNPCFLAYVE